MVVVLPASLRKVRAPTLNVAALLGGCTDEFPPMTTSYFVNDVGNALFHKPQ